MLYLDHAATSPLLPEVKKAMFEAANQLFGNAAAIHTPGHLAHTEIEKARAVVARLINADPTEIIFTSGATEGNNTVMHTFAGQEIAVSAFEHPSVVEAAQLNGKQANNSTGVASPSPVCLWQFASQGASVTGTARSSSAVACEYPLKKVSLISIQLANHEIGTVFPITKLAAEAHKNGTKFHTDATQAIGKIPVDVKKLNVDYLTFSAHKLGGPTGVGVLYVKNGAPFKPLLHGGHQENGRRAGTHNTLGIIGLAAAVQYILDHDTPRQYQEKVRPLRDKLKQKILKNIEGSSTNQFSEQLCNEFTAIFSNNNVKSHYSKNRFAELPNILNVSFKGAEGEAIQLRLDAAGIVVSTGSACAATDGKPSLVLMALHDDAEIAHSSIRFSLGLDTTAADIDKIMKVLPNIIKDLQGISTI